MSYKVLWEALCWDVGDGKGCGNGKVMLDWEGQNRVHLCACTHVCLCMRIQMGTGTPRGKLPFARLALDNPFLEEGMGRRGETQKKMTNTALGSSIKTRPRSSVLTPRFRLSALLLGFGSVAASVNKHAGNRCCGVCLLAGL